MQSVTASVWDADAYGDCLGKLFTAFSFTGLKPGFVTERQLEDGVVPAASVVCVPAISHFSAAARATLRKFKGRLVFVGKDDSMNHDEYGKAQRPDLRGEKITFSRGAASAEDLWTQILAKLPGWNLRPAVELRGADGKPVWGVEWRIARTAQGPVVNLCNYRRTPLRVTLARADKTAAAHDVLTGSPVAGPLGCSRWRCVCCVWSRNDQAAAVSESVGWVEQSDDPPESGNNRLVWWVIASLDPPYRIILVKRLRSRLVRPAEVPR